MTRSRGQGENLAMDVPSSPQRKTKRSRLSSASGSVRTIIIYKLLLLLLLLWENVMYYKQFIYLHNLLS